MAKQPFKDSHDFLNKCAKINDPNLGQMSINQLGLLWLTHFALSDSTTSLKFTKFIRKHKIARSDLGLDKIWEIESLNSAIVHPFNCSWAPTCSRKDWCKQVDPYIYEYELNLKRKSLVSQLKFCREASSLSGLKMKLIIEPQEVKNSLIELTSIINYGLKLPQESKEIIEEVADKDLSAKEAYEINKTSKKCVLCGAPTVVKQLLTSSIYYCSCVEKCRKDR